MIRLACVLFSLLAACTVAVSPAMARDLVADLAADDADTRVAGLVTVCLYAALEPEKASSFFIDADWTRADEFDGTYGFQSGRDFAMFWQEPGFCMFETDRLDTAEMTALLTTLEAPPTGNDAQGCSTFIFPLASEYVTANGIRGNSITVTLTGGGNDPACTSDTEAALRFEVTQ